MSAVEVMERSDLVASRSPLANQVATALRTECGLAIGTRVVVAVSGGPDSVALAAIAAALNRRRSPAVIDPVIAHVDHGLRSESVEEAALVRRIAADLEVPFVQRTVNVQPSGEGVASAARQARYRALLEMAAEVRAAAVLTAHHADDQAETLLLALSRGTGIDGIAGMPWVRALGDGVVLVRPLLGAERQALATLLKDTGLPSCQDPGNTCLEHPRALLRHEVLPRLERIHPGAAMRIAALAQDVAALRSGACETTPLRRWDKLTLASMSASACARTLRDSVKAIDASAGGCSRSVWEALAGMVHTQTTDTRAVDVTRRVRCVLDASEVRLEEISDA